jgi:hypothetical protein
MHRLYPLQFVLYPPRYGKNGNSILPAQLHSLQTITYGNIHEMMACVGCIQEPSSLCTAGYTRY